MVRSKHYKISMLKIGLQYVCLVRFCLRPKNVIYFDMWQKIQTLHLKETQSTLLSLPARGAESESESPGVVATSQESESIKLPRLRLRNVLFEYAI